MFRFSRFTTILILTLALFSTCLFAQDVANNTSIDPQNYIFTAEWDVTPSHSPMNGLTGLSQGEAAAWGDVAAMVRARNDGTFDARNAGSYTMDDTVAYAAETTYHIKVDVNVWAKTYSVSITPDGGTETVIATDYAFRTGAPAETLNNFVEFINFSDGGVDSSSLAPANFVITPGPDPMPTITGLMDDFGDGVVSAYWVPEHAEDENPPIIVSEADSALTVVIDKSKALESGFEGYGFSALKFDFTADNNLDMSMNPYASVMIKTDTDVPFQLGVADEYSGGNNVTITKDVVAGDQYTQLYFDFTDLFGENQVPTRIVKCYLNFQPGRGASGAFQGTVMLKDFRLGDQALLPPPPPKTPINMAAHPPAIDGVLDDIWKTGPWNRDYVISPKDGGENEASYNDASISWRAMWDENFIYFFVDANDDILVMDGQGNWQDDGMEIYIDGDNSKASEYDGINDFYLNFGYSGDPKDPFPMPLTGISRMEIDVNKIITASTVKMEGDLPIGFTVEVAVPWNVAGIMPMAGHLIGLDIHYNDDDDGGTTRETKLQYYDTTDNSWQNPSTFGIGELVETVQKDYTEIWYTTTPPVIDGIKDESMDMVPTYVLNNYFNRADSISSYFDDLVMDHKVVWDSSYIYFALDITDDVLIQEGEWDGNNNWQDDHVELWFDGDNSKNTSYDGKNDIGISFPHISGTAIDSVEMAFGGDAVFDMASVPWAATLTDKGIYLEFALPLDSLDIQPVNGWKVGYELDYNDDDTGAGQARDTKCKTFSNQDQSWGDPSTLGTGMLVGGPVDAPVKEKEEVLYVDKTDTKPVIDGEMDKAWLNARIVKVDNVVSGDSLETWWDTWGDARVLYDSKNFYFFCRVNDDTIHTVHNNRYEMDNIEMYFDGDNSKQAYDPADQWTPAYDENDGQLRFVFGEAPDGHDNISVDNVEYAYAETETGWNLEFSIPFKDLPFSAKAGHIFGYEIQINDNDGVNRENVTKWHEVDTDDAWRSPAAMGTAMLTDRVLGGKKIDDRSILPAEFTPYPVSIDAEMDYAWNDVPAVFANYRTPANDAIPLTNSEDIEIWWKLLWDYNFLYLMVEVKDDSLVNDSDAGWEDDGLEVWFDGDNSLNTTYTDENDLSFSWSYDAEKILTDLGNWRGALDSTALSKFMDAKKLTDTGFILEVAMPWEVLGTDIGDGGVFGFEVDYNDDDNGGSRDTKVKTYTDIDETWQNPSYMGNVKLVGSKMVSEVESEIVKVETFELFNNYPNPFNPQTTISFNLPTHEHVKLVVYDVLGREVMRLLDKQMDAGKHNVTFNAGQFASGVYFYHIQAGENVFTKKMMLLK